MGIDLSLYDSLNSSFNILYIEDNKYDFFFYQKIIFNSLEETYKVKIDHAYTTEDMLSFVTNNKYDLVITDLNIIESRGAETFEEVKKNCNDETPIIILTGSEDKKTQAKCLDAGAKEFFVKGVSDRNLIAKILTFVFEQEKMKKNLKVLEA